VKNLNQIIKTLFTAEAQMKDENKSLYNINLATKSARRSKTKWMKIIKCYNCNEIGHILKHYKKFKKA